MTTRKARDIESGLVNKGFSTEKDGKHRRFFFTVNNGKCVRTMVSQGNGGDDIDVRLLAKMAKQCCLSIEDFCRLIDCTLSRKEYEDHLCANAPDNK